MPDQEPLHNYPISDIPSRKFPWALWAVLGVVMIAAVLVIAAMIALFVMPVLESGLPRGEHPAVGKKLPRLELQPLLVADRSVGLEDLAGKVVLLNFWGTWCPPCVHELPDIAAIENQYADRDGFKLLAVSCGRGRQEDVGRLRRETEALLSRRNIDMPVYADLDMTTRLAFDEVAGFEGYPTTILLDGQGVIRDVWVGAASHAEFEAAIEQVLGEPGAGE